MIFSTKTLSLSNNLYNFNKQNNDTINIDKSLFIESLNYILEENRNISFIIYEHFNSDKSKESSLENINIKSVIEKLIQSFIDILNKVWNKFCYFISGFKERDKIIRKYKDQLLDMKSNIYIPEERYIYTNLGLDTSYTSFKNEIQKEFSALILDLSKFRDCKTYESFVFEIRKMDPNFNEDYFNFVRGKILCTRDPITKEEFGTRLYNFFRNNGKKEIQKNISPLEIKNMTKEYFNFSKVIKSIEKDKIDIETEARKIEREISSLKLENYIRESLLENPNVRGRFLKVFIENKFLRIKIINDLYLQLFSAKLDAAKEAYIQYNKILMYACKTIIKEGC